MAVSRRILARLVAAELRDGTSIKEIVPKLAAYLIETKQTGHIDELLGEVMHELARHGMVQATVTTAHPLSNELKEQVIEYICKHESAEHVQLSEVVSPELLGGIVIETPKSRYDASVKNMIKQLKSH